MRSTLRILTILVLVLGFVPATYAASPVGEDQAITETPESRGVARAVVVAHLVEWARRNRDAHALRTAARMLAEVPMRSGPDGDTALAPVLTPQALRQEAEAMGGAESTEEVAVTGSRARQPSERTEDNAAPPAPSAPPAPITRPVPAPAVPVPPSPPPPAPIVGVMASPFGVGPISTVRRLRSRESWSFVIDARGAQLLRVAAIGDGDTDIDLIVRNDQGQVLCADGFDDHYPSCTLSPPGPARLRVNIVNRGDVWTKVQVLSN